MITSEGILGECGKTKGSSRDPVGETLEVLNLSTFQGSCFKSKDIFNLSFHIHSRGERAQCNWVEQRFILQVLLSADRGENAGLGPGTSILPPRHSSFKDEMPCLTQSSCGCCQLSVCQDLSPTSGTHRASSLPLCKRVSLGFEFWSLLWSSSRGRQDSPTAGP